MISFKPRKYLIIDPKQILAGELATQAIHPSDLVITELDDGISLVLKQGVQIIKYLKTLTDGHEYELVFNSQLTEDEQLDLLNCLGQACRNQGLMEFPKVTAMTVRDNVAFKDVDLNKPTIIKNKDHGIWIAGYGLDLYGDGDGDAAKLFETVSKLLEIKESERQQSIIINYTPSIVKIAQEKRWRTYGSSSLSFKDTLKALLESFETQETHEIEKTILDIHQLWWIHASVEKQPHLLGLVGWEATTEENIKLEQAEDKESSLPLWQTPIIRRDHDFRNTGKGRLGGASWSSGVFEEISTNKEWLGKSDQSPELAEAFACKEKIASDIYAFYGVSTPKIELSKQLMTNTPLVPGCKIVESVHTMSELIKGFKTYQSFCGKKFNPTVPNPSRQLTSEDGSEVLPERGLGQILAVAALVNDIDVIGERGANIGFQIVEDEKGKKYAKTIKIDPGEAFYTADKSANINRRTIRVATMGDNMLHFDNLPLETQHEFLVTVYKIVRTTRPAFRGFFSRSGAHKFVTHFDLTADFLTDFLVERQTRLRNEYESDIQRLMQENSTLFHVDKTIERLEDIFNQEKARESEIMAVQEELYFYIDPDTADEGKVASLSTKIDELLDFRRGNENSVLLLKGEPGSGKSLSLRALEDKLLNKRREDKQAPMPIYIDLKEFNRVNVSRSFQETLQKKYSNEYDPKKTRLVVLMDGYDEIAGGCQHNLYDVQQLKQYAHNIRVIITCRTQYLSTGYQQWFKPAEGSLKELEIQPFSSQQISQYLQRYSEEAINVNRMCYPLEEYQEKIASLPNLKELITNPFILRLVAESLPQLEDYLISVGNKKKQSRIEEEISIQPEKIVLNRYAIYKCFMDHWFVKQERKLRDGKIIPPERQVIKAFLDISRKIALRLHSKKETDIKVREDSFFKNCFDNTDPEMVIERSGCPLKRLNDHQYSFIHKTFQQYFIANGIIEMFIGGSSGLYKGIDLSPELIVQDQGVVAFLQDASAIDPKIEEECLTKIYNSRPVPRKAEINSLEEQNQAAAAANAITFLNAMNCNFSGLDLSNICIPKAILNHGTFEGTNFAEADLRDVNFAGSSLKNANFRNANLTDVSFGEWPYLIFEDSIQCISFAANGKVVAVAMGSSTIIFERDVKTGKIRELRRIQDEFGKNIEYCSLNSNGNQVISCSKGSTPCLLNTVTGECILEFKKGLGYEAATFDFSPDGKQVVFSSDDNSLRIWNVKSGTLTHEFRGHKGSITSCKFSPDGTQIISGSKDKTLRIWDVSSGLSTHKSQAEIPLKEGLNLAKAYFEGAIGLSDSNLMLLYQRDGHGFDKKEGERFIKNLDDAMGNQIQSSVKIDLSQKDLSDESTWSIGKYTAWFNLQELDLSQNDFGDRGAIGLGSNLTWSNLKSLNLEQNLIQDEGAQGLAKNNSWRNLEVLNLRDNRIGDEGAKGLATNKSWSKLEDLNLMKNLIGDEGAKGLATNKSWSILEELNLMKNQIGDSGAKALSLNASWKSLINVYLKHNYLSAASTVIRSLNEKYSKELNDLRNSNPSEFEEESYIEMIIQSLHEEFTNEIELYKDERKSKFSNCLNNRKSSKLTCNDILEEGFSIGRNKEELRFLWLPYVQSLDLTQEKLTNEELMCLMRNISLAHLEELKLFNSENGNGLLELLTTSRNWGNVKKLTLENCSIDSGGVFYLETKLNKLEELNLSGNKLGFEGAEAFGKSVNLGALRKLSMRDNGIDYKGVLAITKNQLWENMVALDLSKNKIGDEGVRVIGSDKIWKNLNELRLNECDIGNEGGLLLTSSFQWSNIQVLDLANNDIGLKSILALSKGNTWRNLEVLDLSGNKINDDGGVAIGENKTWANLKKLYLENNKIQNEGAICIETNKIWTAIEIVSLKNNKIEHAGAIYERDALGNGSLYMELSSDSEAQNYRMLDSTELQTTTPRGLRFEIGSCWKQIRYLDLSMNKLGKEVALALSGNWSWTYLEVLDLSHNNIGDEGSIAIGDNSHWINLKKLKLENNSITPLGIASIGKNSSWIHLEELWLSHNSITDEGVYHIVNNSSWKNLKILILNSNNIGDDGVVAIRDSTLWTKLEELDLSSNNIGDAGAYALGRNTTWVNLKKLNINNNKIGGEGGYAIRTNSTWSELVEFHANGNNFGDRGAQAIGSNYSWPKLKELHLSNNGIGDEGGAAIGMSYAWGELKLLDLSMNSLGKKSAEAIGNNTHWRKLRKLWMQNNNIPDEGGTAIGSNKTWTRLEELDLSNNYLGDRSAQAIGSNKVWENLKKFALSFNKISDEGGEVLGKNGCWKLLEIFECKKNMLGNKTAKALAANITWSCLKILDLSDNQITDEGAATFGGQVSWVNINQLNHSGNEISDDAVSDLKSHPIWGKEALVIDKPKSNSFQSLISDKKFTLTNEDVPGGSSAVREMFRDQEGNKWIGKCSLGNLMYGAIVDKYRYEKESHFVEFKEHLAIKLYELLGARIPESTLSIQPLSQKNQEDGLFQKYYVNYPRLHVMSKFIDGFQELGENFISDYKQNLQKNSSFYASNKEKFPLRGFGRVIVIGILLHDYDCVGNAGRNMGFVINHEKKCAEIVKIDPGEALSFADDMSQAEGLANPPEKREVLLGTNGSRLSYDELTQDDQNEFVQAAREILKTPDSKIEEIFQEFVKLDERFKKILKELLKRKEELLYAFSPEVGTLILNQVRKMDEHKAETLMPSWGKEIDPSSLLTQEEFREKTDLILENTRLRTIIIEKNPHFVGRDPELLQIRKLFSNNHGISGCAIVGGAGLGKSQLAAEYVNRNREELYSHVIWLQAELSGLISDQLQIYLHSYFKKEIIRGQREKNLIVKQFYQVLSNHLLNFKNKNKKFCIIFDNAENMSQLADYLPDVRTFPNLNVDILLTSRYHNWERPFDKKIEMQAFGVKETQTYIQQHFSDIKVNHDDTSSDIERLNELLGGLPLAIWQAVAFIKEKRITISSYCDQISKARQEDDPELGEADSTAENMKFVSPKLTLALADLRSKNRCVEAILDILAYLSPNDIKKELLFNIWNEHSKSNKVEDFDGALQLMASYSLVTINPAELIQHEGKENKSKLEETTVAVQIAIHRLTQLVIRLNHRRSGVYKRKYENVFDWVVSKLDYDEKDMKDVERAGLLVPHGMYLESLQTTLSEQKMAELQEKIGSHQLYGAGKYEVALKYYEKVLLCRERHYGKDHPQTAITLANLGNAWGSLGDYEKKKDLLTRALEIFEKHYGKDHPQTGATLDSLGNAWRSLGDYEKQKDLLTRALEIFEKHYGKDHPQTGATLANLGNAWGSLGDYEKQKDLLIRALEIFEKHYGKDHPQTGAILANLSNVCLKMKAYEESFHHQKRADEIFREHLKKLTNFPNTQDRALNLEWIRNDQEAVGSCCAKDSM